MSADEQKSLSKIRTFAQDQNRIQGNPDSKASKEMTKPIKKGTAVSDLPKMASPAKTKHTVKVDKKHKETTKVSEPKIEKAPAQEPHLITPAEHKKKEAPEHIPKEMPAFHELQKEANRHISVTTANSTPHKKNHPKHTPKKRDHSFTSTTTIITDNRHAGGNFAEEVGSSLNKWFRDIKRKFKRKSAPKYTVQDTIRRKGVIQKATTKTGALFTADNETLREQIRRRRAQEKIESGELDVLWTPNTESGYALLEAPDGALPPRTQNVQVTFKKRTTPESVVPKAPVSGFEKPQVTETETATEEPKPAPRPTAFHGKNFKAAPAVQNEPEVAPQAPTAKKEEEVVEIPPVKIVNPSQPVEITPPTPEPELVSAEEPVPEIVENEIGEDERWEDVPEGITKEGTQQLETEEPVSEPLPPEPERAPKEDAVQSGINLIRGQSTFSETNSNAIMLGLAGIVGVVVVLVVVVRVAMGIFAPEQPTAPVVTPTVAILEKADVVKVALPETSQVGLEQTILQSGGVVESNFSEVTFASPTNETLRPTTLINLLGLSTNPNFNSSVESLHLLTIDRTARALVFSVEDATTVFGALLAWESAMPSELQTVLGIPSVSADAKFVDRTIYNTDVRVLTSNGNELVTYGFVSNDVVVITTTTTLFERVLVEQF